MKKFTMLISLFAVLLFFTTCQKDESAPLPVPSFTPSKTSALVGETITFTNASLNAEKFSWDFGDGSTSTLENPTHAYSAAGVFNVKLTATGDGGAANYTQTVTIAFPLPVANFTMSKNPAQTGDVITFTNTSVNATEYLWDFGDGSTSTVTNPTHTYTIAGSFSVNLTATGSGGNNSKSQVIVITAPPPVASFTMSKSTAAVGETITFTNTSTNATSYAWNFGDGATSAVTNPAHAYASAGNYTIQLTATGSGGTSTATNNVTITSTPPPPPEDFNIIPGDRIGDFELGDDMEENISRISDESFGHGRGDLGGGYWLHVAIFYETGIAFFIVNMSYDYIYLEDVPIAIYAFDPFEGITEKGITFGSTFAQVTAAYGTPDDISDGDYWYDVTLGIAFWADDTKSFVREILIQEPSGKKSTSRQGITDSINRLKDGSFIKVSKSAIK